MALIGESGKVRYLGKRNMRLFEHSAQLFQSNAPEVFPTEQPSNPRNDTAK